jgi:hypothetical protein
MKDTPTLEAVPVREPAWAEPAERRPDRATPPGLLWWLVGALFGWAWRLAVGAAFGMSCFTSILVVGWLYRWMQGRVLYGWWKQSPLSREGSFDDFRMALGPDAPVTRPRWFLREDFRRTHIAAEVNAPTADGEPPLLPRRVGRALGVPFRSLWLNLKAGSLGLLCTFLLAGWGCLFMTFSWEFGWLNSFHKGYEQAFVGPLTGVTGILLFIAAMLYVPMAQVHQAVTGDAWAFFDFRFVWRLIKARLSAYVVLAALVFTLALALEVLKTAPASFDDHFPSWTNASDSELRQMLAQYYFGSSVFLFLGLLATHLVAAAVYRSAVLKVLRRGRVPPEQLHPRLRGWLDRLDLLPDVRPAPAGLLGLVRVAGRRGYRGLLYGLLAVIWFAFAAKVYVGEFLNYHPYVGFMNHPTVQFPCVNYAPQTPESLPPPVNDQIPNDQ